MFSRIQNRNTGYSENLFSQNTRFENNTISSIDGANALKLDESYQLQEEEENSALNNFDNNLNNEHEIRATAATDQSSYGSIPSGVSIESASYIENGNLNDINDNTNLDDENSEEYTPKLFSEEQGYQSDDTLSETEEKKNNNSEELFDQELINEEEEFEIPAFLRKQKF